MARQPKISKLENLVRNDTEILDKAAKRFYKNINATMIQVEKRLVDEMERYITTGNLRKVNFEFALVARENLTKILKESGYYKAIAGLMDNYATIPGMISERFKLFKYKVNFNRIEKNFISELQNIDISFWKNIGKKTQDQIFQSIYSASIGDLSINQTVQAIRNSIKQTSLKKYAYTYANDSLMQFYRNVNHVTSEQTGWDSYVYVGPVDGKIRPFCARHLNKIYTREEINQMSNGQTGNVFQSGGGYHCRHDWYAVPPDYEVDPDVIAETEKELKDKGRL